MVHAGTIPLYQIYQIKVFRDHLLKQNLSRLAGYFKGYTPGERGKGLGELYLAKYSDSSTISVSCKLNSL